MLRAIVLCLSLMPASAGAFPQYHDISDTPAAQAEARQRHLPLAYLGGFSDSLTDGSPEPGSQADLSQMALATLQDKAVVIFFDGRNMGPVPAVVHAQYHIQDDGPLPNGAAWDVPKIVFSDPDITHTLGRVSHTEMKAGRDVPILSALQVIRNDPHVLDSSSAPPVAPPPASPSAPPPFPPLSAAASPSPALPAPSPPLPTSASTDSDTSSASPPWWVNALNQLQAWIATVEWLQQNWFPLALAACVVLAFFVALAGGRTR
jgi:hypothetical protein